MVRKVKEEALATKKAILKAAVDVFVEHGVARSSLDMIAKKANFTRGAVYWHFKNKVDIFEALQDELHRPLIDMLLAKLEGDHPDPLDQLQESCIELLHDLANIKERQDILRIFFMRCDYAGEMEVLLKKQEVQKKESLKLFAEFFERAKVKGHIPVYVNPDVLAVGLMCYLTGIATQYLRYPDTMNLDAQAPCMMKLFFNGVYESNREVG